MSNHIENLSDELVAANAESLSLQDSIMDLVTYLSSEKFSTDTTVQTRDVVTRLIQAQIAAHNERDAALFNERGPKPVASLKGWACPICREPLHHEIIWNDTEAKAERRMRDHWTVTHKAR